jgi:NAD+-dependent protein deacetylase sirtuin 4
MRTVPKIARLAHPTEIEALASFVRPRRRLVALTGAGVSTESGLPDYRSPEIGAYARNHKPITHSEFSSAVDDAHRKRFWLRSFLGHHKHRRAEPNVSHSVLTKLERGGRLAGVVTQNVDGLHAASGAQTVVELHGSLNTCQCLSCNCVVSRDEFQSAIARLNPWLEPRDFLVSPSDASPDLNAEIRPDGDVDVVHTPHFKAALQRFVVPTCVDVFACAKRALVKPGFVFFGGTVDREVARAAEELVSRADALLVLGTTAQTLSCLRLIRRADELAIPIAIVNAGPTRADDLPNVTLRLHTRLGFTLAAATEGF